VPDIRTEITEITTGLATLDHASVKDALESQPKEMVNVEEPVWSRLRDALGSGGYSTEFQAAWLNGLAFSQASSGLRGRIPLRVEWRGPHGNPGYDFIPADLRIDHVYLISCKYRSRVLINASPSFLFERLLTERQRRGEDWYLEVAPNEYRAFYERVRQALPLGTDLPKDVADLTRDDRDTLKASLTRGWPPALLEGYASFGHAVATASAGRWAANLTSGSRREEMLWRLLRLAPAPYFILGISSSGPMRLRVYTPWDWRREFELRSFDVSPDLQAKQPIVRWAAHILNKESGAGSTVEGHVEVRWSHGKFSSNPEAKVYLGTPYHSVPGYAQLD